MNDDYDADFGMAGPSTGVDSNTLTPVNDESNESVSFAPQYLDSQSIGFSQGDGSDKLNTDLAKLRKSLWNEKASPEILQYEEEIVEDLKDLVDYQQGKVDLAGETVEEKFKADLYQMEINRVVYLLKSYLRTRFLKITRHAKFIVTSDEMMSKLSTAEAELVAKPYVNLKETHLRTTFLNDLPEKFQGVAENNNGSSDPSMIDSPNLDEYVFIRVLEDIGLLVLSENETIDLNINDIYVLRYSSIRNLLQQGKLHLV